MDGWMDDVRGSQWIASCSDTMHEESWSVVSSTSKGTDESTPDVFFAEPEVHEEDTPPTEPKPVEKSRKLDLRLDLDQLKRDDTSLDEFSLFVEKKQQVQVHGKSSSSPSGSHGSVVASVDELFGSTRKHLSFEGNITMSSSFL
jgi:hypothetical protein